MKFNGMSLVEGSALAEVRVLERVKGTALTAVASDGGPPPVSVKGSRMLPWATFEGIQ